MEGREEIATAIRTLAAGLIMQLSAEAQEGREVKPRLDEGQRVTWTQRGDDGAEIRPDPDTPPAASSL